ncbi:hypothetical protein [Erwinia phage Snitter]|nr:hypothetical protein [Erwinia phage Snitter]
MEIKTGKAEVWKHAGEAGMQEKIRLISQYFDIKDISIIYNGKMTYIEDRPRPVHRVPAIPSLQFFNGALSDTLKDAREKSKKVRLC